MSELDPAEVAARSLRVIPERFRKELETPVTDRPAVAEREGLPPNYRMRADAHYVDQLVARTPDMAIRFIATDDIDAGGAIDPASVEPLASSLRAHGVLQPLLVRREENRYRVIAGRRRLAAATLAGLSTVPCVVHQVDARKAEELAHAENVRGGPGTALAVAPPEVEREALLEQLASEVDGVVSAAALFGQQALPISKRVTLDLVRSQAARASWLLQASRLLEGPETSERRLCLLGPMLERVRDSLMAESRLSGVTVEVCVPDWNVSAVVNESAMIAALTGAVIATAGLIDQHPGASVTLMIVAVPDEPISIDIAQDTVAVPPELVTRFFDASWSRRPGGWPALLGALAARTVAQQHGGDLALLPRHGRGSTLRVTVGRP